MHPNWQRLQEKWPQYRIDESDARKMDLSECTFFGEGRHEIAVYTFGRYLRLAKRQPGGRLPICIRFGSHFPEYVSMEEPAISHLRSSVGNNVVGMPEPAQLLAIISCQNGRAFWDELRVALAEEQFLDTSWSSSMWISSNPENILNAVQHVSEILLPAFSEESPPEFCGVVISADDIPEEQFSGALPDDSQLSPTRFGNWIYLLKQDIKKGMSGRQVAQERVVLKEDLRRVDPSLYKGQLGWTMPDPGFVQRKGSSSLWIKVVFDSGVRIPVEVYWIDFLRAECALAVAEGIIESYRNTPFDADSDVAANWHRDFPFYIPSNTTVVGQGLEEVYAYTFVSCMEEAELTGSINYPMKIGYSSGIGGALERIGGQFSQAIAHDARVQFIGRCDDGRFVESRIQKHLKQDGRKIETAPGKEWFLTNRAEVEELCERFRNA
ncbi:hypothetical protein GC197_09865 [bacterium]|nr:hypothetical protein [bacterium]